MTTPSPVTFARCRNAMAWRGLTSRLIVLTAALALNGCRTPPQAAPAACPEPELTAHAARQRDGQAATTTLPSHEQLATRELSFESRGATLRATLTLPADHDPAAPRLPGVLLLHDWGLSDRDGRTRGSLGHSLPVDVLLYRDLANALAARGFAVLRFDKRSCVVDTAPACTYHRDTLARQRDTLAEALLDDAREALDLLRQQPEVSPSRVAIVGHGQGAELAAASLSAPNPPAALAILSPSASPIHEVIAYQTEYSLRATRQQLTQQGDDAMADLLTRQRAMLEAERDQQRALFPHISAASPGPNAPQLIFELPLSTWRGFDALHARASRDLAGPNRPRTLAILGSLDADLPEDNPQKIAALLVKQPGHRVELLSDVTHNMILIEDDATDSPALDPRVPTLIAEFLYRALTAQP